MLIYEWMKVAFIKYLSRHPKRFTKAGAISTISNDPTYMKLLPQWHQSDPGKSSASKEDKQIIPAHPIKSNIAETSQDAPDVGLFIPGPSLTAQRHPDEVISCECTEPGPAWWGGKPKWAGWPRPNSRYQTCETFHMFWFTSCPGVLQRWGRVCPPGGVSTATVSSYPKREARGRINSSSEKKKRKEKKKHSFYERRERQTFAILWAHSRHGAGEF